MICKKCGVKILGNTIICPVCGTPVLEEKIGDGQGGERDSVKELKNRIKEKEKHFEELKLQYEQQKTNYERLINEKKKLLTEKEKILSQMEGSIQEKKIKERFRRVATRKPDMVRCSVTAQEPQPIAAPIVEKRNYQIMSAGVVIASALGILSVFLPWGKIMTQNFKLMNILGIFDNGYLINQLLSSLNEEASIVLFILRILCICCFVPAIFYGIHIYHIIRKERYSIYGSIGACIAIFCGIVWFILITVVENKIDEGFGYFLSISDKVLGMGSGSIFSVICGALVMALEVIREQERIRIADLEAGKSVQTLLQKTGEKERFIVKNYQPFLPARIPSATFSGENREFVSVSIINYSSEVLQGILFDIDIENMFGEIYRIRNCKFELTLWKDYIGVQTQDLSVEWNGSISGKIKNIRVYIQKLVYPGKILSAVSGMGRTAGEFVCDDLSIDIPEDRMSSLPYLRRNLGADVIEDWKEYPDRWICPCGMENGAEMTHCFICGRKRKRISDFVEKN